MRSPLPLPLPLPLSRGAGPARKGVFLLIVLAQLAAPGWMMWRYGRVRLLGREHLFRTAPIDPRDPLRGEHVVLRFQAVEGPFTLPAGWKGGALHAVLGTDTAGFTVITRLSAEATGGEEVTVTVQPWNMDAGTGTAERVDLPFDRYYVQEGQGRRAEELMRPAWSDEGLTEPLPAHAVVRVLGGRAVVTDLVIGGRPLAEWMRPPS